VPQLPAPPPPIKVGNVAKYSLTSSQCTANRLNPSWGDLWRFQAIWVELCASLVYNWKRITRVAHTHISQQSCTLGLECCVKSTNLWEVKEWFSRFNYRKWAKLIIVLGLGHSHSWDSRAIRSTLYVLRSTLYVLRSHSRFSAHAAAANDLASREEPAKEAEGLWRRLVFGLWGCYLGYLSKTATV